MRSPGFGTCEDGHVIPRGFPATPDVHPIMEVLRLTVFLSLCLAVWFVTAFVRGAKKRHSGAFERESLLPLVPEIPAGERSTGMAQPSHELDKDHH